MNPGKSKRALDLDIALAHVDNDTQLLSELASMFVQDYPRLMEEARNSILQNNCSELERAAHTLKGRLAFFGIGFLRDQLLNLEMMGRHNDLTRAHQALTEIELEMKSILPEFELLILEQNQ
jgi:HPt (histidine-containing phosphotransfer) domain-containing protein